MVTFLEYIKTVNTDRNVFAENLMTRKGYLKFEGKYYDKDIQLTITWKDLGIC